MNMINKQYNIPQTLILSALLLVSISACNEAKTASDAPNSTQSNGKIATSANAKDTQNDAQSEVRKNQLDADIQAREQRNNMGGNSQQRTDGDLASEVRSKLEANIPRGKLTILAKDANITVSGVVSTQKDLDKIQPLAMEIKGVQNVFVKAMVSP